MPNLWDLSTSEKIRILMLRNKTKTDTLAKKLKMWPQGLNYDLRKNSWNIRKLKLVADFYKIKISDLV